MTSEFNCDLCDKTYLRQGNLARHKAKHSVVEGAAQVAEVVVPLVLCSLTYQASEEGREVEDQIRPLVVGALEA